MCVHTPVFVHACIHMYVSVLLRGWFVCLTVGVDQAAKYLHTWPATCLRRRRWPTANCMSTVDPRGVVEVVSRTEAETLDILYSS